MAEIKVKLSQTSQTIGGVSIDTHTQGMGVNINTGGMAEVVHNETLKGKGTTSQPLGLSDGIISKIDTYIHEQGIASDVWEIEHNLDKFPSVSIVDSANNIVMGYVNYIDNNKLTINFNGAFTGKAYLN